MSDTPSMKNWSVPPEESPVGEETVAHQPGPRTGGEPTTLPPSPSAGDGPEFPEIPGYEFLERLPGGGMGVVYKARQVALNRVVALKMIRAGEGADQLELARFRQEAEAVAGLNHPHVLPVYDFGEYRGLPYFTMEFVAGGSLARLLAAGPLPPREAAALLETLARTVQYVHDRHIVHRDLKPDNILLAADARGDAQIGEENKEQSPAGSSICVSLRTSAAKIADFGIAKRLNDDRGLTAPHTVLGTPSYMAPEQAAGQARDVGPAADVYALGAILYECLTGRPPFLAATRELTMMQVLTEPPRAPTSVHPDVSADLEAVCLKCLEKDPARRYATAADLADDLARFREGRPLSARPLAEWERHDHWAKPAGYEILDVLGAGMLGIVYKAQQVHLNRLVTLKTISSRVQAVPGMLERFRAEAEAAARLHHPNIVQIYDFRECGGQSFFVLEHLAGGDLSERDRSQPMAPAQAAELVEVLAWAIHYAHEQGVVHSDLRPLNVLLTATGVPKITGFGVGRLLETGVAGSILGLSNYIAPEQAGGRAGEIGPATDVYALGAILYELLTDRPPVLADTVAATLEQVRRSQPVPPRALRPELPPDLEAICLKCLEKEPGRRYGSALALAEDLRCFRGGEPVSLGITNEWEKLARWAGYQVLQATGHSGMATLYKARQLHTGRLAALQLVTPTNPEHRAHLRALYQAEAGAMARLAHPNIVQFYEAGEIAGCCFLAREFVDGPSLLEKLGRKPLPAREAAGLLETLAHTLHFVHQKGYVHRDVKPANILLTADGTLKLTDFSLARWTVPGQPQAEAPGTVVGTPAYMAPEQARGDLSLLGPASDVYAVGVILYEMLTGRTPFQGPRVVDLLVQVLGEEPVPPSQLQAQIPPELEAICLKCLRKDPKDRYATADRLANDLRCFLEGKPVQARPLGVWGHVKRWVRRPPQEPLEPH
jgi:serine/threonine protein kinase